MLMSTVIKKHLEQITEKVTPANQDIITCFENISPLFVKAGVFDPSRGRSAKKFAAAITLLPPKKGDDILEIGVGSGALSLHANKRQIVRSTTGVDLDIKAIQSAKKNFETHNTNASLYISDMFNDVSGKFDYIMFNAPTAHPEIQSDNPANVTVWDPSLSLKKRFVEGLKSHLNLDNPDAMALMTYTIYSDYDGMKEIDFSDFNIQRILVDKDDLSEVGILVITPK